MKKIFTFIAALMAVVAVNATQVVFDFTNPEGLGITAPAASAGTNITDAVVYQGVTMTATDGSTATRVWNSSGVYDLRVYKDGTLTFAAEEAITAIEFAGKNINLSEISGKSWTGSATSVKFTATATCNINTVKVYIGEDVVVWTPDTVSVSEAIALIAANDSHDHFVKGVVMGAPFITYANFGGKASFWLADETNANDSIELYDGLGVNGAKWATLYEVQSTVLVGDTVLVYAGALSLYTAKNFYEITGGYYVETLGHNPDAVVPEEPVELAPDTITVAEALEIGNALADNATTDVEYVVKGFACTTYAPNEGYTDQTWYMHDTDPSAYSEFQAYQCEPDRLVKQGDYMLVRGKILKYVKDKTTIEISRGTAVHGEAPEIVAIEVSVAEALEIAQALTPELQKSETTAETYAVKGFIVNVKDAEKKTYYMADVPGAFGDFQAFQCASIDYEVAEGDYVIVTGKISTYHGQGSNGEYYSYEISKGALTHVYGQGIENVTMTGKAQKVFVDGVLYIVRDGKLFNMQGAVVR